MAEKQENPTTASNRVPPLQSRFQKGRSGNPGGKPKKPRSDFDARVVARCESKISNGDITVLDLVLNSVIREAARGNIKAAKAVIDLYRDALRKRGQSIATDEADIEAAKRILNLDSRLFADLTGQEPIARKGEAVGGSDTDDRVG